MPHPPKHRNWRAYERATEIRYEQKKKRRGKTLKRLTSGGRELNKRKNKNNVESSYRTLEQLSVEEPLTFKSLQEL